MKKTIQLPPDGEVMCFENYPNDVWYVKNIELPEREIYKISFDSSSDEPKVKNYFPNNCKTFCNFETQINYWFIKWI